MEEPWQIRAVSVIWKLCSPMARGRALRNGEYDTFHARLVQLPGFLLVYKGKAEVFARLKYC